MELPGFAVEEVVTATPYGQALSATRLADGARVRVEVLRAADAAVRDRLVAAEPALRRADGRHLARVRQVLVEPVPGLVREDVRGADLSSLTAEAAPAAVADVLDALADLHAVGLVHGALTVADVLLDASVPLRTTVRVTGWGVAAVVEPAPPTPADDVRAAGRLLQALLGDAVPGTVAPVLAALLGEVPPSAAEARHALRSSLQPAPGGRGLLRRDRPPLPPVAPAPEAPPPAARRPFPLRRVLAVAAAVLLAVALLAVGVLAGRRLAADTAPLPDLATGRPPPAGPYVFPALQREDGLLVERTWVLEQDGAALRGTTVVRNPTLEPRTASVDEVVPKTVADDVADLAFTPEPDAVVERDPVVRFEVRDLRPGTSTTWSFVVRLADPTDRVGLVRLAADADAARAERERRTRPEASPSPLPGAPAPTPTS